MVSRMPAAAHGSTTSKIFFRNPIPACAGRPISSASLWQRYSSLVERIGGDSSRGHLKTCCLRSLLVFSVARPQELREGAAPASVPSMSCVPDAVLIKFPTLPHPVRLPAPPEGSAVTPGTLPTTTILSLSLSLSLGQTIVASLGDPPGMVAYTV